MKKNNDKQLWICLLLISVFAFAITGCQKKTETTPSGTTEETQEETKQEEETTTEENAQEEDTQTPQTGEEEAMETLEVSLGNDMGKTITALRIRPTADDEWISITLQNNTWASGLMIPVELKAETIPNPENGWDLEVEFADDGTSQLFEGVPLNTESTLILTSDGVIAGS